MLRKLLMTLLLGVTLAGAVVTSSAQEPPKPDGPEAPTPIPKPDPGLRA